MNVVYAGNKLLEVLTGYLLLKSLVLNNQFKKLASTCKLHNEVEITLCLYYFVDLNNVGVMQFF